MSNILDAIDDVLTDWQGSSDSMLIRTAAFRSLTEDEEEVCRTLCGHWGIDGYTVAYLVQNAEDHCWHSPYRAMVQDALCEAHARDSAGVRALPPGFPASGAILITTSAGQQQVTYRGNRAASVTMAAGDGATDDTAAIRAAMGLADFRMQMEAIGRAASSALGPWRKLTVSFAHDLHASHHPRAHVRCRVCHPQANPARLCIDGHAYHRRQGNRRKRGR